MLAFDYVTQPKRSTLDVMKQVLATGPVSHLDVAAAYVTTGGAQDVLGALKGGLGSKWPKVPKRWLISFDYCRTEPIAVEMLRNAPNSIVKVHDGKRVVLQNGQPTVPFHPKAFFFRSAGRQGVLAGSGNVSRSGLNTGHEVGMLLEWRRPVGKRDAAARAVLTSMQTWYEDTWKAASSLSSVEGPYAKIYESTDNLRHPTPTEDDECPAGLGASSLSPKDLQKLRACRHFWIQAGNITKNLGPSRPGNQLMMKRLSRVFFGVPATDVPHNSPLKTVEIAYNSGAKPDCSLTFSDNAMDKLTLPVPGHEGPPAYDNENLLFTRVSAGKFTVELGTAAQKAQWAKSSKAIDAHFAMPPHGREWGVF